MLLQQIQQPCALHPNCCYIAWTAPPHTHTRTHPRARTLPLYMSPSFFHFLGIATLRQVFCQTKYIETTKHVACNMHGIPVNSFQCREATRTSLSAVIASVHNDRTPVQCKSTTRGIQWRCFSMFPSTPSNLSPNTFDSCHIFCHIFLTFISGKLPALPEFGHAFDACC